ncbi:MAG TPA: hypothetical protein VL485_32095 [Ktedonobacteraceae bacterium]|jgi:hypothetical protein|nr:hypothetical protein [Ktedonobacteraceae bacterium]
MPNRIFHCLAEAQEALSKGEPVRIRLQSQTFRVSFTQTLLEAQVQESLNLYVIAEQHGMAIETNMGGEDITFNLVIPTLDGSTPVVILEHVTLAEIASYFATHP